MSSWCFRHLVDPTGTLIQAYELLKPATGIIFVDGFAISTLKDSYKKAVTENIMKLFYCFKSPCFMGYDNDGRRLHIFVMQKSMEQPAIPLVYKDLEKALHCQVNSQVVTIFDTNLGWPEELIFTEHKFDTYYFGLLGGINRCFTFDQSGEMLLNWARDMTAVNLAREQKIMEIFREVPLDYTQKSQFFSEMKFLLMLHAEGVSFEKVNLNYITNIINQMHAENPRHLKDFINHHSSMPYMRYMQSDLFTFAFRQGKYDQFALLKIFIDMAIPAVINSKLFYNNSTLLMETVKIRSLQILELLLKLPEIDISAVDNDGRTALDLARFGLFKKLAYLNKTAAKDVGPKDIEELSSLQRINQILFVFTTKTAKIRSSIDDLPALAQHIRSKSVYPVTQASKKHRRHKSISYTSAR